MLKLQVGKIKPKELQTSKETDLDRTVLSVLHVGEEFTILFSDFVKDEFASLAMDREKANELYRRLGQAIDAWNAVKEKRFD